MASYCLHCGKPNSIFAANRTEGTAVGFCSRTCRDSFEGKKKKMKYQTAMIYETFEDHIEFYLFEEDLSRLDDVFINLLHSMHSTLSEEEFGKRQEELSSLMYDEEGQRNHTPVNKEEWKQAVVAGASIIVCGFIP